MQAVPALAAQWLANGHTETQIRVTESFVGRETQPTQVGAWTLRNHDKQRRTCRNISPLVEKEAVQSDTPV